MRLHPDKTFANIILPFSVKEDESNICNFLKVATKMEVPQFIFELFEIELKNIQKDLLKKVATKYKLDYENLPLSKWKNYLNEIVNNINRHCRKQINFRSTKTLFEMCKIYLSISKFHRQLHDSGA